MQGEMSLLDARLARLRAWAVHAYTGLGLALGFAALIAIVNGRPLEIAILMCLAAVVDGTDGMLARRVKVSVWTPEFDGRKLDDITDYLNYALIPVFACYRFGLVAGPWSVPLLALVLLAAVYGFCQQAAKTDDKFFTGFPNYWNIVAFYMYLLGLPPIVNGFVLLVLAVAVFVPVKYLSSQTEAFRPLTLGLMLVWVVMILGILIRFHHPNPILVDLSLFYPAYYVAMSFYLQLRPRAAKSP